MTSIYTSVFSLKLLHPRHHYRPLTHRSLFLRNPLQLCKCLCTRLRTPRSIEMRGCPAYLHVYALVVCSLSTLYTPTPPPPFFALLNCPHRVCCLLKNQGQFNNLLPATKESLFLVCLHFLNLLLRKVKLQLEGVRRGGRRRRG